MATSRASKYIIVNCGCPHVADEMPPPLEKTTRLGVIQRTWEECHVFDSSSYFRLVVRSSPQISTLSKVLANSFYNLVVCVDTHWHREGDYALKSLIALVKAGLEGDDDIIQQWFGGRQVIKLMKSARTWDDTVLAIEAICGSHECDDDVLGYVNRVLGNKW